MSLKWRTKSFADDLHLATFVSIVIFGFAIIISLLLSIIIPPLLLLLLSTYDRVFIIKNIPLCIIIKRSMKYFFLVLFYYSKSVNFALEHTQFARGVIKKNPESRTFKVDKCVDVY